MQWGINGYLSIQKEWDGILLNDKEVKTINERGTVVFLILGPNTRETKMYSNTEKKNKYLDKYGFSPIAEVVFRMDVVDQFYAGYGDDPNQS